nr:isoform 2 of kinesin-like protein kif21b [Quercus suber]
MTGMGSGCATDVDDETRAVGEGGGLVQERLFSILMESWERYVVEPAMFTLDDLDVLSVSIERVGIDQRYNASFSDDRCGQWIVSTFILPLSSKGSSTENVPTRHGPPGGRNNQDETRPVPDFSLARSISSLPLLHPRTYTSRRRPASPLAPTRLRRSPVRMGNCISLVEESTAEENMDACAATDASAVPPWVPGTSADHMQRPTDAHIMAAPSTSNNPITTAPPLPASPASPSKPPTGVTTSHMSRPSTSSMALPRSKRSSSRVTDFAPLNRANNDDEVKTAVRVAVRVRPPLKPSDPGFDLIPQRFRESTCEVPTPSTLTVRSEKGKKLFAFDRVFDETTTQDGVWDYLSDSVSSFVKGYNVSIMAYGQSGAGKSFTMGTSGPTDQNDPDVMGIVPRAAQALFEQLNGGIPRQSNLQTPKRYSTQGLPSLAAMTKALNGANGATGKNWELRATYVEIHNEILRDLLVAENTPDRDRNEVAIREDKKGRILLTGLNSVAIHSVEDLHNALNFGSSIRQTDATAINARSSRSHAVFTLNLIQKRTDHAAITSKLEKRRSMPAEAFAENVVTVDSKLHFVDLAGSERLKNTGATGERAKEGISINGGLASLGKVISQLSSKSGSAHISYRDSKLTRLLQDSLGGNAITFMVACVTPAVFHLNETLNTLSYAYRAQSIQSKPEIQQSHEDNDKQAAIERLRAEVTFLRDQIRSSEQNDQKSATNGSKRGKESALQIQLMDMQESYNALSQRHANLIGELSKARQNDGSDTPLLNEAVGGDATERIARSNSFAQAVDVVLAEYERTIQSLEASLSTTRSSLSSTESTLMEKDTRIAYMGTIQQQLQARVQKFMDREASNEAYLRELENQVEGTVSGEEQAAGSIAELRKELARVRESESGAEEYISTLEERLADAEADQESMQREIERLESVVERQRSIGRLDNLLGELDDMGHDDDAPAPAVQPFQNGQHRINGNHEMDDDYDPFRPPASTSSRYDDDFASRNDDQSQYSDAGHQRTMSGQAFRRSMSVHDNHLPALNDLMADKVENLTLELFDLRSEHEANLVDFDNLQQKYQTALETLARVEYGKEAQKELRATAADSELPTPKATDGPSAFLADAGMDGAEMARLQGQPSSSQSAESLSHGRSSSSQSADTAPAGAASEGTGVADQAAPKQVSEQAQRDMDMVEKLQSEHNVGFDELTEAYNALAQTHEEALLQVRDLKQQVQRAQNNSPASPSGIGKPIAWRRKSEDMLGFGHERASRSFTSLKNIAQENLESNPDARQSFDLNLNTLVAELNGRSERVQALEVELANVRKEMESKQTIISGLTRERSSMRASSGVDFSVVGQMREQLMESENQIRMLHEQHADREKELREQIDTLKASLEGHQKSAASQARFLPTPVDDQHMPGDFPETPAGDVERELGHGQSAARTSVAEMDGERVEDIARLQKELTEWESRHNDAMTAMKASEAKLLNTIADLEDEMQSLEQGARSGKPDALLERERTKHRNVVDAMQKQIDEHKANAEKHVVKLDHLEQSYGTILQRVEEDSTSRAATQQELQTHKDLVANLESQLQFHKAGIEKHQESLESLKTAHSKEIDDLTASMATAKSDAQDRHTAMEKHHEFVVKNLQNDLTEHQTHLAGVLRGSSNALGYQTDAKNLPLQIKGLVEEGKEVHARHLKTTNELKAVQEELQHSLTHTLDLESKISELKSINEEAILNFEKVAERERKSSRLVDELEEQLNSTFDTHKAANHRMSTIHSETLQARMELERELEDQKMKNASLEVSCHRREDCRSFQANKVTATSHCSAAAIRRIQQLRLVQPRILVARGCCHRSRPIGIEWVRGAAPAQIRLGHASHSTTLHPTAPSS